MSNRDWQHVSQVLGVLLVVLVAAAALVVMVRGSGSPGISTPPPTRIALASPSASPVASGTGAPGASETPLASPSGRASPTPTPKITPSPAPSPTPTAEITPTPSPTPRPTPSPTPAPTAPLATIRFKALGFDGQAADTPTARTISFHSVGPGEVSVHLARTTAGNVRLCLAPKNGTASCRKSDQIDLTASTEAAGKTAWTVTGIGTDSNSPVGSLRITFRSSHPGVTLDGFRFQGTANPGYNGVEVELDVLDGSVHADGHWDGAPRAWDAQLTDLDTGTSLADATGTGNDLLLDAAVSAGSVHLSLTNTEATADQAVFLHAVIRWP